MKRLHMRTKTILFLLGFLAITPLAVRAWVLGGPFQGTNGTFSTTVSKASSKNARDTITVTYTPDTSKVNCADIYLVQTCKDVDQSGNTIKPKDYKGHAFRHLQDDMTTDGTYVDHLVCEKDPYYNGEDEGKDANDKGSSDGHTATPTSITDAPSYSDGIFPTGVTTITSTFEVCAVCKSTGKILDCVTWKYTRTKGAANKGSITDASGTSAPSEDFKAAKKKYEKNHKNGTVCPEEKVEKSPVKTNVNSATNKKTPDPPIADSFFDVFWDVSNSGLEDLVNVEWEVWLDGSLLTSGVIPTIAYFDFATVAFEVPGLPEGPHMLTMVVDPYNALPEYDETDNTEDDEFEVASSTGVGDSRGLPALRLHAIRPNPVRGALHVSFSLAGDAPARLEIFDLAGRRLVNRNVGDLGRGPHALRLDVSRKLEPGVYFLRLTQGEQKEQKRFVYLR